MDETFNSHGLIVCYVMEAPKAVLCVAYNTQNVEAFKTAVVDKFPVKAWRHKPSIREINEWEGGTYFMCVCRAILGDDYGGPS